MAAVFGSFLYQGQTCMSTERILVDEAIADEFVAKFAVRAKELPAGAPTKNAACVIGPMVAKESGPRLSALIDDALAKGAKLAVGGRANGTVMTATIVDHVRPGMKIYEEETSGPITPGVRADECRTLLKSFFAEQRAKRKNAPENLPEAFTSESGE